MTERESSGRELAKGAGLFFGHAAALVVGVILMLVGVGMGVTLVLLPLAIPLGLAGLFIFLWGLFGRSRAQESGIPGAGGGG
jgi:hypothetical protein